MTIAEFDKLLRENAAEIKAREQELADAVEGDALRFIDDNFRNQGWEGIPWEDIQRDGTILVDTATLKRSFNGDSVPGEVRIYTNVPYAGVHNEGFEGDVTIKEHKRSKYKKTGKGKKVKSATGNVKAHTRKMNIKQRQFAPTESSPSPTLEKEVSTTIENHFNDILKPR